MAALPKAMKKLAKQKGGKVYDLTCEKQQKKFDEMLDS